MDMNKKISFVFIAIMAAALTVAMSPSLITDASAKITSVCENPGGQEPKGNCQGNALEEENQNPTGHAPPGQN